MTGENPVGRLGEVLSSYAEYVTPEEMDLWPAVLSKLRARGTAVGEIGQEPPVPAMATGRRHWSSLALVATVVAAVVVAASAYLSLRPGIIGDQAPAPSETVVNVQAADDYMSSYDQFSGCVLLSKGDEVLLSKCYGMADYEEGIPNTLQTIFPISAVTTHFTAAAILLLEEEGLLDVGAPIGDYLPNYPNGEKITVHHLLTHTSGIPEYVSALENPLDALSSQMSADEVMELFRDKPLDFIPGEMFSYTNSGYVLLGLLIEELSGLSYEQFLRDRLFQPVGMASTGYDRLGDSVPRRAKGHNYDRTQPQQYHMASTHGSAALASTISDLRLWFRALNTKSVLTRASIDKMLTPFAKTQPSVRIAPDVTVPGTREFSYGWYIETASDPPHVGAAGGLPGYQVMLRIYEDEDVIVILLGNTLTWGAIRTSKMWSASGVLATIALTE